MKYRKSERGQSLVEFAVSLVILLLLLSGAVEFGILFFRYVQLRDAAQEGALYGSTHPYLDADGNGSFDVGEEATANTDVIRARARASSPTNSPLNLNIDTGPQAVTIDVSSSDGSNLFCEDVGHGITVTVRYTHRMFMPFLTGWEIPLEASVTDTILTPMCPPPP